MTAVTVDLPDGAPLEIDDGRLAPLRDALERAAGAAPPVRLAYAAAHVVMKPGYADVPHSPDQPGTPDEIAEWIDWEATGAVRAHLAACGFGIAEAMDTAQRFSLGWPAARELIRRCGAARHPRGFVAGAGFDHRPPPARRTALIDAVSEQVELIRAAGGIPIILPLSPLVEWNCGPDDYVETYAAIVRATEGPLFVHWLGEPFAPHLKDYFPADSFQRVMDVDPARIRGAKLSLLDADREVALRPRLLANEQILLTGDDLNFSTLIAGDAPAPPRGVTHLGGAPVPLGDFSHALLGILDAIAEPAGLALRFLARGDRARYHALMDPCERLSRIIFEPPTRFYKTGLAYLAWLAGRQDNPMLANHEERARPPEHFPRLVRAAAAAGVLPDAQRAAERALSRRHPGGPDVPPGP